MDKNLKKILIISSYAPPAIGGPQNLYNLLRDFPISSYFILTSFYNIDNLSAQKGTWLDGEYIFYDNPGATKKNKINYRNKKASEKKGSFLNWLKHLAKRSWFIRNIIGIPIIIAQIFWIVRQGKKSIKEKQIDVLLGFSDYGPAIISTYILHKRTKIPFRLFLFDIYKGNYFPFPGGILSKIFESKIFKNAETIIVTNEGTKQFYIKRYGKNVGQKIVVIHNATFPVPCSASEIEYEPKPPYKILFTGRIYWPQIGAIKNLIQAIKEMNDLDIKLDIYCPNPRQYLEKIGIEECGKIKISVAPPQEMPRIQARADILFLPLSWNTKSDNIINTATPGKLTDYLVAGKPMLIHAPSNTYLVKYAKKNNFAMIIDKNDVEELKKGIKTLLENPNFARQLIKNARKTFFKNHDANKNAEIFKSLFSKTI